MSDHQQSIQFWRYTLVSRDALNRASNRRTHGGALIRVGKGHGCIHPWPELGDATLAQELEALRRGSPLRLGRNALACAALDGSARERGEWLFHQFDMPASHALWTGATKELAGTASATVTRLLDEGFDSLKIKGGPPIENLVEHLEAIAAAGTLRLRLDFNETLTERQFKDFADQLGQTLRDAIQVVEDPLPYQSDSWGRLADETGLPLALDRSLDRGTGGYAIAVIKPSALTSSAYSASAGHPLLVTSSMQHPLGQLYDAWMTRSLREPAGLLGCGLLTHECYATDAFIERLTRRGPVLVPPRGGTGLGFDDLLERLPWKPLN